MRKKYIKQTMVLLLLLFYSFSEGQTLLHYWNFNSNASVSAITTPTQTNILGASLTANNSATSLIDFANGTAQNFDLLNLNTRNSDVSGTHLRFNNPIGGSLLFALPTTGYENIIVKFATRRSSTGAGNQLWSYSIDGTSYVSFATVVPNNGDPAIATLDFSAITLAKNNPNFKLKVEFSQGAGGIAGNNRFDNFTTEGTLIASPTLNIDLSTYVRVGRYNLPEPTRTTAPTNSLLAQEVSAVTYNWDTNTLFVVGDGSTSIVQVSKTGQLIDSMTLAQGSSPQGTEFYDTEGLTYIGNGQFVMTEERDRQVVKFTYVAGSTLTRSATQTVKLGTFVNNIGTEGLSYDPLTNGYVVLKEITPIGIFQTGIDFVAGTATNGSATTENSVNLFDPALLGVSDVADVFALSNIPSLNGQSLYNNLLVLSQENAKVVNTNRSGVVANSLTIVSDAGNPLDVASQQHEGLTMDRDGILYITSENGGGDIDHPQLWVYAPSTIPNQAPTVVALTNTTTSVLENSNTSAAVKVSDIAVTDDGLGTNNITLSGADANFFQITGSSLYIKAGTVLDYETKTSYNVTVNVDDTTVGNTPDASVNFVLAVTDVAVETTAAVSVSISEVASWSSSNSLVAADWFEVTNTCTTALDVTGWKIDDNSNTFTAALALSGITSIAAGESVIFLETGATNSATIIANFKSAWFGSNVPSGLQVGYYTGSGAGLSSSGDAVNLYDASGVLKANVVFGVATTNKTFNNALGLTNSTITTLSQVGVNDAFAAVNDTNQIGSPGTVGKLFISEVAPWSSSSSPVGADWFEVTNTKAVAVDITGWKIDDNSQSPAAAVALNGITSINPGESVIFIETNDLAGKTTAFLNNWFGTNPSSGIRIGNYTGSGVGLSSSGDQVNLYNATSATPQASVLFGASPTTTFATFDNAAGLNTITTAITQVSAVGTKGAFIAANSVTEIGSPGTIVTAPCPTITVTATPVVSSVCAGTTTTVTVTATGGTLPYTVSGSPLTVGGGTFNYTVTDAKGCTATTAVTIIEQPVTQNTTAIAANNSYTWAVTGQTYITSGVITGTTTNCVTEKLDLTITKTLFTGPTTTASPYVLPVGSGVTTTSILTVPETVGGYKMAGIPDGLGAFDNNNGTFTLLMNHELGNTLGAVRAHGAKGAFVSKWIINKSDLSIASGSDLMTSVYGWNTLTQSLNTTTSTIAFQRFCSADLPAVNAFYNPITGLGTQARIFMHGEEGGTTGYQVATVATGVNAGNAYVIGKFNVSTNGSGLTGVGAWENALANPFPQDKTVVVGNNDGGTGIMNNSVCVYQGFKTNSGTEVDKAGLTNGTLKFVNVTGNAVEIPTANATSRATNITTGTAFTLNATTSTTFSRPEDGAWDPTDVSKYYFVTTDRLDQVNDGIGTQIGRSRLWRLNFTDITNPDLGGTIDLLLDGTEGQVMMDNMSFDNYGHILLLEDVGGAAHNGKVWQYTIATDQLKMLAKHDPAKFGDIVGGVAQSATLPFNNDEETSGIIDMSAILGAGNFLLVDQAHYNFGDTEAVEGGQLLKLYNPDTFAAAQCATTSTETVSNCGSYVWNGKTYNKSGIYTYASTNLAGCFHTATLNLTIIPAPNAGTSGTLSLEIGKTPTDAQLFAALTGADSGGTWSHSGLVYTYTLSGISPCTVASSTVTVTNTIPSAWSLCYGAKVADAVGATTLKFYLAITGGAALALTTNLVAKTYYATQIVNGLESTPRVPVTITINSVPIAVATVTTSDSVLCKYIGTTNTVTYTATLGASSYIWTVPAGVSIVSGQGTNTLVVDFHNATTSGTTFIGSIGVKAVNASGCTSASAKSIALSTRLPVAPSAVKLTYNGVAKVRVGNFIGDATKTLVLTATDISGTANHYTWDLPVGVAVVSGDKNYDNTIAINLGGVAAGNTDLVFKAFSVAGCGISIARTLAVKRDLPSAPLALALTDDSSATVTKITNVSAYTGKLKTTPLTLTATPTTVLGFEPTSYKWILPSGVTVIDASADFVSETSGFKTYTSTSKAIHINLTAIGAATSLLIQVYGVNGNGTSLLARNLTLTSSIPSRPGALTTLSGDSVTYNPICATLAVKVPNVLGVTYTWSVVGGALATIAPSNSDGNEAIINVSQLPSTPLSYFTINVKGSNGTGSSSASAYTIRLGNPCGTVAKQVTEEKPVIALDEFTAIAYPNPFATVFTIEFTTLATEKTAILVYDMAGRLVEQVQVATNTVVLGLNYPAGVYNVIVNQGGKTKTLRVIKK